MIIVRLGEDLPPVLGDATQLRQVIHNLLQNAEDALAGRDDPRIEVRTERVGDACACPCSTTAADSRKA